MGSRVNDEKVSLGRLIKLGLLGLLAGPIIGFPIGTLVAGAVMFAIGLSDRLTPAQMQEIGPWTILMGIIIGALNAPAGAVSGITIAFAPGLVWWKKIGIAAVTGLIIAL